MQVKALLFESFLVHHAGHPSGISPIIPFQHVDQRLDAPASLRFGALL